MKSFTENLEAYQKATGLSRADVVELSGLSKEELEDIEYDDLESRNIIYQFCYNLDIDYTSLYSDSGFKSGCSLFDQFDRYPDSYKRLLTNHIFKSLAKTYGDISSFKELLKEVLPDNQKTITRFFSGNSTVTGDQLKHIRNSISESFSKDKFDTVLNRAMFSLIPNYNYSLARSYFKVSYKDIASSLHTNVSNVGNWGGLCCAKMPDNVISDIARILGGFSKDEFQTTILTKKDFKGRECAVSLGSKLPDPPTDDKGADRGAQTVQIDEPKIEPQHSVNLISPESSIVSRLLNDNNKMIISDERILKMYNKLSPSNKAEVNKMITDLFFSQL